MSVGLDMSAAQMLRHGRDVLFTLCVMVELVFGRVMPALALDQVSLQLKWKHQFQFAGYYAAVEKGFYRDNGLEVALREGGPGIDAGAEVAKGAADFGVCTTSVLVNSAERANNVVLGVIFQHSAAIILVPHRAGIHAVSELKGHELMDAPGSDDIAAMLKHEGVDYADLPRITHSGNPRDLLSGKADAMVAYSTNEPYLFEEYGTPYLAFSPRAYGVDFYGDNLCTSKRQIAAHPERAGAFRAASLRGWAYALAHKEEIVDLIRRKYSAQKSQNALLFEAARTELLIEPHLTAIGHQSTARWKAIARAYVDLGMLGEAKLPEGLIYASDDGSWRLQMRDADTVGLPCGRCRYPAGPDSLSPDCARNRRAATERGDVGTVRPPQHSRADVHHGLQLLAKLRHDQRDAERRRGQDQAGQHRGRAKA